MTSATSSSIGDHTGWHWRCCILLLSSLLIAQQSTASSPLALRRERRQLPANREPLPASSPSVQLATGQSRPGNSISSSAFASASTSLDGTGQQRRPTATASISADADTDDGFGEPPGRKRVPEVAARPAAPAVPLPVGQQEQQQQRPKKRPTGDRRRPSNDDEDRDDYDEEPRRRKHDKHEHDDGGECLYDDHDYDYHHQGAAWLPQMFDNPIVNFKHIMGNVFDQMPNFGPYGGLASARSASASSFSNDAGGDGYSSSIVTNNGRTRGLISETRNGRTKTRRIGNDDDDEGDYGRSAASSANYEDDD